MRQKRKTPAKAATKAGAHTTTRQGKHNGKAETCKCPRCGFHARQALFAPDWLDNLEQRAVQFWQMGFGPDLAAMSLVELHSLWRWLLRQGG